MIYIERWVYKKNYKKITPESWARVIIMQYRRNTNDC